MARWLAIVGGVLLVAAIALVLVFDWNWLKGPLEVQASAALGREVRVQGDLDVDLGWTTVVTLGGLVVRNPDWGSRPEMTRVERIQAGIEVWPLLSGDIVLPFLDANRPDVLLEQRPDGTANWAFGGEGGGQDQSDPVVPVVHRVQIDEPRVRYQGPERSAEATFDQIASRLDGETFELDAEGELRIQSASGVAKRFPVTLQAAVRPGPDGGESRIEARLEAGTTEAEVDGTIGSLAGLTGVQAEVTLSSENLNPILALFGTTFEDPAGLRATGRLLRDGAQVRLEDVVVERGESTVEGRLETNLEPARPHVTAELRAPRLRAADVIPAGSEQAGDSAGPPEPQMAGSPDGALVDLVALPAIDLDLTFHGESVEVDEFHLAPVDLQFRLRDHAALIDASGAGRFRDRALAFEVEAGSEASLNNPDARYPISIGLDVGRTRASAEGTADHALDYTGLDVDVALEGPDLDQLGEIIQIALPETLPYSLSGKLRHQGSVWALDRLRGDVGDSDLRGRVAVDVGRDRPLVTADLASRDLDLDDLGVLMGAPPATGPGETGAAPGQAEAAEAGAAQYLLPDDPFDLPDLRAVDADVAFAGERVSAAKLPLEGLHLDLTLEDGVMRVQPLRFDLSGGELMVWMTLDATVEPLLTTYDLRAHQIDVNDLLNRFEIDIADVDVEREGSGTLYGRARFETRGNSVHRAAASADGNLALIMDGGAISGLAVEAIGLDAGEAIGLLLDGGEWLDLVSIRCLVASFEVDQGVMKSEALALETPDSRITGAGEVDLGAEQLDLVIEAHPNDPSFLTASSPVRIEGNFLDPGIEVMSEELQDKLLTALGLGVVLPVVGAAIPFIETGAAQPRFEQCTTLIEDARQAAKDDPRDAQGR